MTPSTVACVVAISFPISLLLSSVCFVLSLVLGRMTRKRGPGEPSKPLLLVQHEACRSHAHELSGQDAFEGGGGAALFGHGHSRANPLTLLLRSFPFLPSSGVSLHLAISTTCWSQDRFDPFVIAPQQEMSRGRGAVQAVPGWGRHVGGAPGGEAGGLRPARVGPYRAL